MPNWKLTIHGFITVMLSTGLLSACGQEAPPSSGPAAQAEQPAAPAEPAEPAEPFRLPVSLNEVMVALVNHSADPIWLAAWRNPETDKDWRNLERMAYQLQVAGALLVIPGNGPKDDEWTADPQWTAWSNQLEAAGDRAVKAVAARDLTRISSSGDEIVEICEGCHMAFKPDLPTSGMFGELSPTAADFEEEEADTNP
jgi:hypothetical protein